MNTKEFSQNIINDSENFADILSACSTLLKHSKNAKHIRDYLDSRCSDYYQNKFNFGYFPDHNNISELIEVLGGSEKLYKLNLIYDKETYFDGTPNKFTEIFFRYHNLILPYKNCYGDIVALVGRTLLSSEEQKKLEIPKYKNTVFSKNNHLFGLYHAKKDILKKDGVILVEGQFDFISCYRRGFRNVVAVGCANLSKTQFHILKRYTNNLYFLFDNDKAGKIGFEKAEKKYSDKANIQKINLPDEYKDIDEYLDKNEDYSILDF